MYVVVPAMGVGARFYRQFADALAENGSGVAVTELRGHEGMQPSIPGRRRDFGYADLADDLDAAIEEVRERAPGSPVVVLGHSLGAQVACVSVARGGATVDALAFVAAGSVHWRLWPLRYLVAIQLFAALAAVVGHFPGRLVSFAGREARGVMRDWARLARTGRLTYGRPPVDAGQSLAVLELPVLVLSLHGDTLAPQRAVGGLAALLPSARVTRRHLVLDAGKRPHFGWASRPDAVISELEDWSSTWVQLPDSV
ncbi:MULTISPECIES: alpha/beta fold hydrolase [unclassified Cryobacterium]|uniref:alpha/beta fold hydrolase n=1 Tax=unclassified Cryobacterium TaxID=2649013 RepID=UPI001444BCAF